jgi:hypothetical protein
MATTFWFEQIINLVQSDVFIYIDFVSLILLTQIDNLFKPKCCRHGNSLDKRLRWWSVFRKEKKTLQDDCKRKSFLVNNFILKCILGIDSVNISDNSLQLDKRTGNCCLSILILTYHNSNCLSVCQCLSKQCHVQVRASCIAQRYVMLKIHQMTKCINVYNVIVYIIDILI